MDVLRSAIGSSRRKDQRTRAPRVRREQLPSSVCFAEFRDGIALPVIDVTLSTFRAPSESELAARLAAFVRGERRRSGVPKPLQRALLRPLIGRSFLGRGLLDASGGVLGGMTMYVAKLGPDILGGGYAGAIDRRIAAAPPSLLARLRLQDMAELLAAGLAPLLAANPARPIQLINIAGGPSSDSWNALLLLRDRGAELLARRSVQVDILDLDEEGPAFGARALAALAAPGCPLQGLELACRPARYDWHDTSKLRATLRAGPRDAVVAVSSEGGLFEYGADAQIVDNLGVLSADAPPDAIVVGSVTRAEAGVLRSDFAVRPRSLEAFSALARGAGWRLHEVIARPFCYDVRLVRAL